jgi:hypothetical protein
VGSKLVCIPATIANSSGDEADIFSVGSTPAPFFVVGIISVLSDSPPLGC